MEAKPKTLEQKATYHREYRLKNLKKMRAYNREYNKNWRKIHGYGEAERWIAKNPDKVRAQYKLRYAVKSGKVKKYWCEICHSEESVAHHDDYMKPLEVRWLCRSHHRQIHYTKTC